MALLDAQGQAGPRGTICMTKGMAVQLCGHKQGLDAFFKGMWEKRQGRGVINLPDSSSSLPY